MENSTGSPFTEVTQIGIVVKDLDKTVKRLTVLGIGPFKSGALPPDREEWYGTQRMYADFKIASAYIGNIQIELIQPVSGASPHKDFLESKGEGIQHIACAVKDVRQEVDRLTGLGAEVILRAKFPGGREIAYCDLGSGLFVELVPGKKA